VTTDLNGGPIVLNAHVVVGERPGPTFFASSTLHGGEWVSIEVIRRIMDGLDPSSLAGTVIGLPVANPTALGMMTRTTPDESDNTDLNRVFPGHESWITEQIAAKISGEILPQVDALIDFHYGGWGSAFGAISFGADFPDPQVAARSKGMAYAFGFQLVRAQATQSFPGPRSMVGYAGSKGIAGIIGGVGGAGFELEDEERWLEINVQGTRNVLRYLGMLDEPVERKRALEFSRMIRVNPTVGGFVYPERASDELGREVHSGELLAKVVSPYTFEVLEELRAPCDGYLMYFPRWYPVRPGDWAYGVIDKHDPDTRWVEPEASQKRS
jgi:predicted deacylase